MMGEKGGFDSLKDALAGQFNIAWDSVSEETKKLRNSMGGEKVNQAISSATQWYENTSKSAQESVDLYLRKLAQEIDPSVAKVNSEQQNTKIQSGDSNSDAASQLDQHSDKAVNQTPNSIVTLPEKSDKTIYDFDTALSKFSHEEKLSTQWLAQNPSVESLNYREAVDKMQAAALVFVHNGINAGDVVRHPLGFEGEKRLATVLATELLYTMNLGDKQFADLSNKLSNNSIAQKTNFASIVTDMTKSINESGIIDQISGVTSFMKAFNNSKPVLVKANMMLDLLREGSTSFDAKTLNESQLYQLYNVCGSGSFPTATQIDAITRSGAPWSRLGGLKLSPVALEFINNNVTKLPFVDPESQAKTSELVQATEQGMDSVYEVIGQWFGAEKGSETINKLIEGLMKLFDNSFIVALANLSGVDLNKIKKALSGEFTPAQEEQFEILVGQYKDLPSSNADWLFRLSGWINDPQSQRYKALEKFDISYLEKNLAQTTPHISVVQALVGDNKELQAMYFETTVDAQGNSISTLKTGVNFGELAKIFCSDNDVMKSVIDSTKWQTSHDVAGLLIAQWMKGNIRGVRAWTKYKEQSKNTHQNVAVVADTTDTTVESVSLQQAEGSFAKLGKKVVANTALDPYKNSLFSDLNERDIDVVFANFVDPKGQYGDTIGKIDQWLMQKAKSLGPEYSGYGRFKEIALYTAIAENAKAIFNYDGNPNIDVGGGYSGNAFQINAASKETSIALAKKYYNQAKSMLSIEQIVPEHHFLGQLLTWIGHLMQKEQEDKKPFEGLFTLKATDSKETFTNVIRDNVQIGSKEPGVFQTDTHVRNMMNGRVDQLFDFASSTATVA